MWPSALPRPRNARPSRRPTSASPKPGRVDLGRCLVARGPRGTGPARGRRRSNSTKAVASSSDHARSASTVLAEVGPQRHGAAVGLGREHAHLGRDERQAVLRQRELAGDGRPQATHRVGERRHADAGGELLGHRGAADPVAGLEDQDAQAARGEVRGGRQAVVAGADDDRVVAAAGGRRRRHVRPPSGRGPAGPRARRAARSRPSGRRPGAWTSRTATGRGSGS